MGAAQEAVVTRFMEAWGDGTIEEPDVETIVSMFTERLDNVRSGDLTVEHALVAIFEVEPDGLISAWREYFDPGDVNRQLKAAQAVVPRADV